MSRQSRVRSFSAALGTALGIAFFSAAAPAQIYFDDFDGDAATDLNGTAPDIRLADETWIAGEDAYHWKADGSKTADGYSTAWLPFTPTAGNIYSLSLDVNPDISDSNDWFAIGFSETNSTDEFHTTNTVYGWMLNRENDASDSVVQTFLGVGTAGAASHDFDPDKVGSVNLSVMLNTLQDAWTVEWLVDGETIRDPVAYETNPTINYVGMAGWNTATGTVDNFSLNIVPEPTSVSLLFLGGLGLALRRRRNGR